MQEILVESVLQIVTQAVLILLSLFGTSPTSRSHF